MDTFTYRILTTRSVRSSTGQSSGRIVITCTSSKGAGVRNDEHWAFRDYLRDHPDVAREYEDLKRTVAARIVAADPESQERYAVAKTDLIERVVALAVARGHLRDWSDQ